MSPVIAGFSSVFNALLIIQHCSELRILVPKYFSLEKSLNSYWIFLKCLIVPATSPLLTKLSIFGFRGK